MDRTPREATTRERQERKMEWRPGSALEAPPAPAGFKHRWIRESAMQFDDRTNIHKKRQEGWELVRADEYPDYTGPVVDEGRNAGVIGVGGLILARMPVEMIEQRKRHYARVTQNQMDAVDNDWMRDNNPLMQKSTTRKSSVSFGSRRPSDGDT